MNPIHGLDSNDPELLQYTAKDVRKDGIGFHSQAPPKGNGRDKRKGWVGLAG